MITPPVPLIGVNQKAANRARFLRVSSWESGEEGPTYPQLKAMPEMFEVPIADGLPLRAKKEKTAPKGQPAEHHAARDFTLEPNISLDGVAERVARVPR